MGSPEKSVGKEVSGKSESTVEYVAKKVKFEEAKNVADLNRLKELAKNIGAAHLMGQTKAKQDVDAGVEITPSLPVMKAMQYRDKSARGKTPDEKREEYVAFIRGYERKLEELGKGIR
jgi:hypothetical protein